MTVQVFSYQIVRPNFPEDEGDLNALRSRLYVLQDPSLVALGGHPAFPDRVDYQPQGSIFTRSGELVKFNLGSNADYAQFIDALAKLNEASLGGVWEKPEDKTPFRQLVYWFASRGVQGHGFIGPDTSARLAIDFAENDVRARSQTPSFYEKYKALRQSFENAQKGGAVNFIVAGP